MRRERMQKFVGLPRKVCTVCGRGASEKCRRGRCTVHAHGRLA